MPGKRPSRPAELLADLAHGLAGLAISALGVAVAAGVILTGTAQAETSGDRLTGSGHDVTRAEPIPQPRDIDRQTQAERRGGEQEGSEGDSGTLDRYETSGGGKNPVRDEVNRRVAEQREKQRRAQEQRKGEQVSETSRDEISRTRAEEQRDQQERVQAEQRRLEEEKRKKEEEEKRLAEERRKGTLRDGEYEGPYSGPTSGEVSGGGGAAPVTGHYTIAARWGAVGSWSRYHTGIDLSAPIGRPVVAAADGVVRAPVGGGWAGIHVIIEHPDGDATLYAHLASARVRPGDTVKAGQVIGSIGMTGRTFGPHLHFEYYPSISGASNPYSTSDPYTWMLTKGVRL